MYLYTSTGRRFIDGSSGAVAANLGHGVTEIADAMYEQAKNVGFVHSLRFETDALHEAARRIAAMTPEYLSKVFFASGGAEANESAFKLSRQWHIARGDVGKHLIIGFRASYHGNTLTALGVGGDVRRRRPYQSMLSHTLQLPSWREVAPGELPRELAALVYSVGPENIAALVLEPVSGSQLGAYEPPAAELQAIEAICRAHGITVIVDEVMTGFARCGPFFAFERAGLSPDLVTFGKGSTAGYAPLSGVIVSDQIAQTIREVDGGFNHSYTYSGHPVMAAAAATAARLYVEWQVRDNVAARGPALRKGLEELASEFPDHVADVRGVGLLCAVEFAPGIGCSASAINDIAMSKGIVLYPGESVSVEQGSVVHHPHLLVAPPLTVSDRDIDEIIAHIRDTLAAVAGSSRIGESGPRTRSNAEASGVGRRSAL